MQEVKLTISEVRFPEIFGPRPPKLSYMCVLLMNGARSFHLGFLTVLHGQKHKRGKSLGPFPILTDANANLAGLAKKPWKEFLPISPWEK